MSSLVTCSTSNGATHNSKTKRKLNEYETNSLNQQKQVAKDCTKNTATDFISTLAVHSRDCWQPCALRDGQSCNCSRTAATTGVATPAVVVVLAVGSRRRGRKDARNDAPPLADTPTTRGLRTSSLRVLPALNDVPETTPTTKRNIPFHYFSKFHTDYFRD